MSEKVAVPYEVAQAIQELRSKGASNFGILNKAFCAIKSTPDLTLKRWAFEEQGGTVDLLMLALINGYEVEQTPEDRLREYYGDLYVIASNYDPGRRQYGAECKADAVISTLDLLGIKIKGVNA